MPLTVFTQRNCVTDFFRQKCTFRLKTAILRFWAEGLKGNRRRSS